MQVKTNLDKYSIVALIIGLIVYPVLYSTDFFSSILFSFVPDQFISSEKGLDV